MLLNFSASNLYSIKDEQTISFIAGNLKDKEETLYSFENLGKEKVLPSMVVYGANASGKTNILRALRLTRDIILHSFTKFPPTGGVPGTGFLLDEELSEAPKSVSTNFMVNGIRYYFEFSFDDEKIIEEKLTSFPHKRERELYSRTNDEIIFGNSFKGLKKPIEDALRNNSLVLSTAAQFGNDELKDIYSFFQSIKFLGEKSPSNQQLTSHIEKSCLDARAIEFLKKVGTGIVGYEIEEQEVPKEVININRAIEALIREQLSDAKNSIEVENPSMQKNLKLLHIGKNGKEVKFEPHLESAGTKRLILLLSSIFKCLDEGNILLIDEIDISLHTLASAALLYYFSNKETNPKGAQLIATTHDTNILSSGILRRDQIWFVEKDEEGASHYYSLSDFNIRDSNNYEKGYIDGRFGAIPYSGDIEDIVRG